MRIYLDESNGVNIHVDGIVQGVGFRPFVYGLAKKFNLVGWVRNTSAGVDIALDGPKHSLESFILELKDNAPPLSHIDEIHIDWLATRDFQDFKIFESRAVADAFQPISPDVSICADCLRELFDPANRRYRYPFINCTNCGPRFTIIKDIPYDRPLTTMASFKLCHECGSEYADPLDRRFHAQPVACPECGPNIWLENKQGSHMIRVEKDRAIHATQELLAQGKIVAIKGLGGFHLACDANNPLAVAELRRRKLRVDKPFALMLPDIETVEKYCLVEEQEKALLESQARPIVLLKRRSGSSIALETAPGLDSLGCMLPYTPLHYLLFDTDLYEALVMTSGNFSEEPIVTDNQDALIHLNSLADAFLMHDREIHIRCDDSVMRVFEDGILPIRRSRGYAPYPVHLKFQPPAILACGGELKNTFCITRGNYAFLSHHIGDLENYVTLESFEKGITHFERLFRVEIQAIAHDLHPDYLATRYAQKRAIGQNLPDFPVQHHHAHIVSCMAENSLSNDHPVIGVAYDGTGYGEDGTIWGGEFLVSGLRSFRRDFHLSPVRLPGADLAIREPWRLALAWLDQVGIPWDDDLPPILAMQENSHSSEIIRGQLRTGLNSPWTSSMGRLFDACSALAGIRQSVNYEAQAAIEMEARLDPDEKGSYGFEIGSESIDPSPLIHALVQDIRKHVNPGIISARFHNGVAQMTLQTCQEIRTQTGIQDVVLSGGVWQNVTLLRTSLQLLRANGFNVFTHNLIPPNDGGLALGQAVVTAARLIMPQE
jgi:hydrogenase maturation protein HypF